jgi:hypothetical protein
MDLIDNIQPPILYFLTQPIGDIQGVSEDGQVIVVFDVNIFKIQVIED